MHQRLLCLLFLSTAAIAVSANTLTPYGYLPHDHHTSPKPCIQWQGGTFEWPCPSTKALYKSSGKYISKNIIATRAQISCDNVFLALPRYKCGSPATLVTTTLRTGATHTTLKPFPCWSMQEEGNCQALQSVVDIIIDNHDIIWVLDTGIINSLETPLRKCPPKIVAFHTKTGKVLKIINLEGLTTPTSRLQYLVVDYAADNRCFVYVSDASCRSIIVYDVQASRGFRVVVPKAVLGKCCKRDVLYLALVRKSCGSTVLYFTFLGSKRLFSINTEHLRKGISQGRITGLSSVYPFYKRKYFKLNITDVGVKPNKLVIIGTDNGSAIFFRYEGQSEVYRWDSNTCFKAENFRVVYRSQTCQLATHALADYKRGRMRVLESNFPDYMKNTVGCGADQQLSIMQGCW